MAQLDASLILAGRPLDVVGAMRQGNAAAMETNALRQNNQLTELYRQQGAGLLAGDQGALNALAGIAPDQAFNMRGAQQDFAMNARKMEILNAEEKRAIADAAAQMDAAQKEAALAQVRQEVFQMIAAPTPEIFNQMAQAVGKPELVGQFENRKMLGAQYITDVTDLFALVDGPAAADNQTERDIALLGEVGIPRDQAIRITQLYTVAKDPVTGEQVLIDKSTGRPVEAQQPAQAPQPAVPPAQVAPAQAAPQADAPLSFGEQYQNAPGAFGWEGLLKRGANALTDVVPGIGTAFPTEQQSLADFRVLGEALVNDIASAYPRQPPSWLLQNISELTPKPGSVWEGPDSAAAKLKSLGASMEGELRIAERQLTGRITPAQRQELELRKIGIDAALERIRTALTALEPTAASGNKTSSGVTWSIE